MIPSQNIVAWGGKVPWAEPRQIEQDLIICRALVALFSDEFLCKELRFRGGTALNKLRALLQRNKGRDLFDLAHAKNVFPGLDFARTIECFGFHLRNSGQEISRLEAEKRMFEKYANPSFLADMRPLLSASEAAKLDDTAAKRSFESVFNEFIVRIPGDPWARTEEMKQKFDVLR